MTQGYCDGLPPVVRDHLVCTVVDRLIPVTQKRDIEGLMMGVA